MSAFAANNYYLTQKEALLDEFDTTFKYGHPLLVNAYGAPTADRIVAESRRAFEMLLPEIPYIGGRENALTENLVMAAMFLAFHRVMKSYGKPISETFEVIYEVVLEWLGRYPPAFTKMMGTLRLTPLYMNSLKNRAERSQQRQYPGDWVYSFVEGDGINFDYGLEYHECGICKFFNEQGAAELIPYMCALDFPMLRAYGLDLKRTMTLGGGAAKCDFKIKKSRPLSEPDLSLQDMGVP